MHQDGRALAVLTRPEGKNERLASMLTRAGIVSCVHPVLSIEAVQSDCAILPRPENHDLVVFVSGNAVQFYREALVSCGLSQVWPAGTSAATVGVASARALLDSGWLPAGQLLCPPEDGLQDSEALWRLLQPRIREFERVLIVRGQSGRNWLSHQFEQAGVKLQRYAAYQRKPLTWSPAEAADLRQQLEISPRQVIVLTSSESMRAFFDNVRQHKLERHLATAGFLLIHPRLVPRLFDWLGAFSVKVDDAKILLCVPEDRAMFASIVSYLDASSHQERH